MTSWAQDPPFTVRLRRSTTLQIGPDVVAAAGVARLVLPGGLALVDPMTPNALPTIEVWDPAAAGHTVRTLFGAEVASIVAESDQDDTVLLDVAVPVAPHPLLGELTALGALVWLAGAQPWPLHPTALALELIVRFSRCREVLDAGAAITEAATDLALGVAAVDEALQSSSWHHPDLPRLVADAARALLPDLATGSPEFDQLATIVERWLRPGPDPDNRHYTLTDAVRVACEVNGALHAGDDHDSIYVGTAAAEWSRNPSGVVSRDERAVFWSATVEQDHARVTVAAEPARIAAPLAGPDLPEVDAAALFDAVTGTGWTDLAGPVSTSLHTPSWPLPLVEVLLTRDTGSGDLVGSAVLRGGLVEALRQALLMDELIVDTHAAGGRLAHLRGYNPVAEEARRWTARALAAQRIAATRTDPALVALASDTWSRALASWSYAVDRDPLLQERARAQIRAWETTVAEEHPRGAGQDVLAAMLLTLTVAEVAVVTNSDGARGGP